MAAPKVVVTRSSDEPGKDVGANLTRASWRLLWWVGLLLLAAGLVDVGLALYPAAFGQPTWRFAAFASVANGLPLLAVGILTATMAAVAARRLGSMRFALVLNVIAVLAIVALVLGFLTGVGPAFQTAAPEVQLGLRKAVIKTLLFSASFGIAFLVSALTVARTLRA
jgi:hypothetical protein